MPEEITFNRRRFLGSAALTILPIEGELPSLGGATAWLNSLSLTPADLRGKVVLVDFWTYTCTNWLRQLPYVAKHGARVGDVTKAGRRTDNRESPQSG